MDFLAHLEFSEIAHREDNLGILSILRSLGPTRDIVELEHAIKQLLKRGFADGFLSIKAKNSDKYLELTKYITPSGRYGLYVYVPIEQWSESYIHLVQNYFATEGIALDYEMNESDGLVSFLRVDCENDAHRTYKIVKEIFTRIFGVPKSAKYSVVLSNCSPWDELIESPRQKSLSWARGIMQLNALVQERLSLPLSDLALSFTLGCVQMVGVVGLVYIIGFDNEARSWVNLEVVGTVIKAPILGLIYWSLILIGSLRVFTRFFWVRFITRDIRQRENRSKVGWLFQGIRFAILNKLNLISIVLIVTAISFWMP